jgi:hypothetical protein
MNIIARSALTMVVIAAALGLNASASRADAPWCAVVSVGTGNAYWGCRYRTAEECAPNVLSGNRGFCNPNPSYALENVTLKKHRTARSHRN